MIVVQMDSLCKQCSAVRLLLLTFCQHTGQTKPSKQPSTVRCSWWPKGKLACRQCQYQRYKHIQACAASILHIGCVQYTHTVLWFSSLVGTRVVFITLVTLGYIITLGHYGWVPDSFRVRSLTHMVRIRPERAAHEDMVSHLGFSRETLSSSGMETCPFWSMEIKIDSCKHMLLNVDTWERNPDHVIFNKMIRSLRFTGTLTQCLRAKTFPRLARHVGSMPSAPFGAKSLRKLQISQYNKKWGEKMGLSLGDNLDLLSTANPNDKHFWPEAGDRMFPRGEQIFWILNVSCEGRSTQRLLQATSLHQLYTAIDTVSCKMRDTDDAEAPKSYDIHLEGELMVEPVTDYSYSSDTEPFEFPMWRQLALCSFYHPGDEINVELVAKPTKPKRQTDASKGKPYLPFRNGLWKILNDCCGQWNQLTVVLHTWWSGQPVACQVTDLDKFAVITWRVLLHCLYKLHQDAQSIQMSTCTCLSCHYCRWPLLPLQCSQCTAVSHGRLRRHWTYLGCMRCCNSVHKIKL